MITSCPSEKNLIQLEFFIFSKTGGGWIEFMSKETITHRMRKQLTRLFRN